VEETEEEMGEEIHDEIEEEIEEEAGPLSMTSLIFDSSTTDLYCFG